MCAQNINDKSFKDALQFMQFEDTPTMRELTCRYRKLSLDFHPDKNQGMVDATEKFQELTKCFKLIGEFIVNNVSNNVSNDEEEDYKKVFKMYNEDRRNMNCHTVLVENEKVHFWEQVLRSHTHVEPRCDKTAHGVDRVIFGKHPD